MRNRPLHSSFSLSLICPGCEQPSGAPRGPNGDAGSASRDASTQSDDGPPAPAAANPDKQAAADSDQPAGTEGDSASRPAEAIATPEQLAAALKEKNPGFSGQLQMEPISADLLALVINDPNLKDISPLARQRIGRAGPVQVRHRRLEPPAGLAAGSAVPWKTTQRLADISALRGMPLQKLYLSRTRVENLGPLRGAPLEDLNLLGTRVKDLSPLAECPDQDAVADRLPGGGHFTAAPRAPGQPDSAGHARVRLESPGGPFAAAAAHRRDRSHRFDAAGIARN